MHGTQRFQTKIGFGLFPVAFLSLFLPEQEIRADTFEAQPHTVRVVYIVPSDREPWEEVKQRATDWLEDLQWFFADEMRRHGHGPKTFDIARDDSGGLVFHQIRSPLTREEFIKSHVNNSKSAAAAHGLRAGDDGVVYFHEAYAIVNGKVEGAGARGGGGEAFLSSVHLKMARREWLDDNQTYGGSVFDWIADTPMRADTLSWNGRGRQLGDVSGSGYGIMAHELGHAFGLSHVFEGDANRRGNVMGNGARGMRGFFVPELTSDFCVLSAHNAAVLNENDFFKVRPLKPRSSAFAPLSSVRESFPEYRLSFSLTDSGAWRDLSPETSDKGLVRVYQTLNGEDLIGILAFPQETNGSQTAVQFLEDSLAIPDARILDQSRGTMDQLGAFRYQIEYEERGKTARALLVVTRDSGVVYAVFLSSTNGDPLENALLRSVGTSIRIHR